eukprot:TRINITY_DN1717_c0_g1_i2.p2 TRINITY_DN1717_c0_g1~~TRINITY_DN1717_c0_g1_i2.p2  ORF type:complete len:175 (+),score=14.39 TRINITY_DN1717_c0_g1_i2:388-912(+)
MYSFRILFFLSLRLVYPRSLQDDVYPGSMQKEQPDSCKWYQFLECAGVVAKCIHTCDAGHEFTKQCMDCMGSSWGECKSCFHGNDDHFIVDVADIGLTNQVDVVPLDSSQEEQPDSCKWYQFLECAGVVAKCIHTCDAGHEFTKQCMDCMGSSWGECKSCFHGGDDHFVSEVAR